MKVFVVWEPVIASDFTAPSTAALRRIPDARARQFWDPDRLLSHAMGERPGDTESIVWDVIAVYPRGVTWTGTAPPTPAFQDRPVVNSIVGARAALLKANLPTPVPAMAH